MITPPVTSAASTLVKQSQRKRPATHSPQAATQLDQGIRVVHSVCLGCNARCGNRQIVKNGKLEKISGNPYHPYNTVGAPLPYATPVADSLAIASPVCGKAHDAAGYVYNEHRLLKPLKRAGRRGEGRFEEISWERLIAEIGTGGKLFAHLGEEREVPGLAACISDAPIDPEDKTLGSQRNGFTMITGRLQAGRQEFIDRFVKSGVGSINRIGHTDICGLGFRMGNFALTEGKEVELKADPWNAAYILVFGANIYEALQPGVNTYGAAVANRYGNQEVQFTVVDPRAQNCSVHAHDWVPVLPGRDGAFAMGMIRWIVDNNRYNATYLSRPNPAAAKTGGFASYANATHLVIDEPGHPHNGRFLRLADLKSSPESGDTEIYMVLDADGTPQAYDTVKTARLEAETHVSCEDASTIGVATAFTLLKRAALARSLEEYSQLCGIPTAQITRTAIDFTSHGTRAAVCQYHGAGNYTHGTHAAFCIAMLNVLIGSFGMRGGYLSGGGAPASWRKGRYELNDFPGRQTPAGVKISREGGIYEETAEYAKKKANTGIDYPSRRPWFPFTKGGLSVEAMSGIDAHYPYRCQVLFTYFYNPVYSTPGGYRYQETLADPTRVPLHVSIDIGVNESNIFADYIVPDVTYLEGQYGWLNPHSPALRFTGVRAPALEPLTGKTTDGRPFCLETLLIDLAESLDIPGFGDDAIRDTAGNAFPLHRAEDFYLRAYANIAVGADLPEASPTEIAFVEHNYPLARFKGILQPGEWRQLCHMLARGGIFTTYNSSFVGDVFKYGPNRAVLYNEQLATTRNTISGKCGSGTIDCLVPADAKGKVIAEEDESYPFTVVSHKMHVHSQSRTIWHRCALELFPDNPMMINREDGRRLGLQEGDRVRLESRSNPQGLTGTVRLTSTIRPGCVGISFHYGHSQLGASPLQVKGAPRVFMGGAAICTGDLVHASAPLEAGVNPNMIGRLDPNLDNTPLVDTLAGIPDFSSTRVRVIRLG